MLASDYGEVLNKGIISEDNITRFTIKNKHNQIFIVDSCLPGDGEAAARKEEKHSIYQLLGDAEQDIRQSYSGGGCIHTT